MEQTDLGGDMDGAGGSVCVCAGGTRNEVLTPAAAWVPINRPAGEQALGFVPGLKKQIFLKNDFVVELEMAFPQKLFSPRNRFGQS